MPDVKGADDAASQRLRPVREVLPEAVIRNREDMAVMLACHNRLLRELARRYLPGVSDYHVETTVERAVEWMLRPKSPSYNHGLRYATQVVWRECQRTKRWLDAEADPVDPIINRRLSEVADVLERLGPKYRQTLREAFMGRKPVEIARAQGITPARVHQRLHHARRRVLELLGDGGNAAYAFFPALGVRLRGCWHRGTRRVGGWVTTLSAPTTNPFAQLAIASLAAASGLSVGQAAAPTVASTSPATLSVQPGTLRTDERGAAARPDANGAAGAVAARPPDGTMTADATSPRTTSNALPSVPGLARPGTETPEDTQFMTAAAAANYPNTHTIVALGTGRSCTCEVLFQSTDAGASWTPATTPAPTGAEQIALPPTYPADPRIFIGTSPVSGAAAYVAPSFDAMPQPLPGPAGHVALAATFGHGDDRVYITGNAVVVAVSVDAMQPVAVPVLSYPQWAGAPASAATPSPGDGAAVLVLAPPGTVAVGNPQAGATRAETVFACGGGTSCSPRGVPPTQVTFFSSSATSPVAAAWWTTGLAVSSSAGLHFTATSVATSGVPATSVATTSDRVWAVMETSSTAMVAWIPAAGGRWVDVTRSDAALKGGGTIIAIPGGPVLDLLRGGGIRCTADGALTWGARCP